MKHIFLYEWKYFLRNKMMLGSCSLMLLIGLYALYYGHSFNRIQQHTIYRIDTAYQNRIQKQLASFGADTATKEGKSKYSTARDPFLTEYQTRPMAWKSPLGLQAMSLGQSDNQPFYYNLWVYNNVYNTKQVELRNPDKLLFGNFDLAFVFLYLLPLMIIAFTYNIISQDKEQGITGLLLMQGITEKKMTIYRLLFRAGLVFIVITILSLTGFLVNRVLFPAAIQWMGTSLLYLLFWMALVYAVLSAGRSGAITALQLVSIWVLFLVLIPSLINNFQHRDKEAPLSIANAARDYPGQIWDMDKKRLADTLFMLRPDWKILFQKKKDTNELRSTAYAYLMGKKMNRVGSKVDSIALQQEKALEKLNFINPVYTAQMLYNKAAGTELSSFVHFRKAVAGYQENRYELITKKRLPGENLTVHDYSSYPVFKQPDLIPSLSQWLWGLAPLLIYSLLFMFLGNYQWRKQSKY